MAENMFRPGMSDAEIEEEFLNRVPDFKACFKDLIGVIGRFAAEGKREMAEACAGLLEDTLAKSGAESELVELLELRPAWQDSSACAAYCLEKINDFCRGGHRRLALFVEASGLAGGADAREAFRRLKILRALAPGRCCYEKTWGLGRVADVDDFERKLVVDFEGKRAHRLAFAYAAEALIPLEDSHILALKLRSPEEFARRVKEDPAGIVKSFLELFGGMSAQGLRSLLTGLVVPEKDWGGFWAAARGKLASDPRVQMPSGRNDPIKILAEKKEFDARWIDEFSALRDVDRIFDEIEALYAERPARELGPDFKAAVEDRLKFAVRGMGADRQGNLIRALLLADEASIAPSGLLDLAAYGRPASLLEALRAMPARMIRPFLALLDKNSVPAAESVAEVLAEIEPPALNESIAFCRQSGKEALIFGKMRSLVQNDMPGAALVAWIGSNLDEAVANNVCDAGSFAQTALALLQKIMAGGRKRDAGQLLREVFTDREVLDKMLRPLEEGRRLDYCRRIGAMPGLAASDKTEIAAKIIPLFPETAPCFGAPPVAIIQPKLTSFRVYREKQLQLEKIINEEIPRNSKEIGLARSYGDLRENFEYKAAREMQGLLMRRKAELEQMLSLARGSDFSGLPHEAAGQGTSVEIRMPDGKTLVYNILGEYDSDDKLGIISCRSKLAEALAGRRPGEMVKIPGENAGLDCLVVAVRPLPQEIKDWINADVAAHGAG